jgi:hypothetical protein
MGRGSFANNLEYYFDFNLLEESKYEVTFSFISNGINVDKYDLVPILSINLGSTQTYLANINGSSENSNFLGYLKTNSLGESYLYADSITNHAITLFSRPSNNNLVVRIDTNSFLRIPYTPAAQEIPYVAEFQYVLTLHFKKI